MEGDARRISYQALGKGVPVRASGGEEIGIVEHVLQVPELDVFDGIVLKTAAGLRFADADQVADITDRYVLLNLPAEETRTARTAPGAGGLPRRPIRARRRLTARLVRPHLRPQPLETGRLARRILLCPQGSRPVQFGSLASLPCSDVALGGVAVSRIWGAPGWCCLAVVY